MRLAIGEVEFATKAKAKAHMKELLARHMGGSIIEGSECWPMVMSLWRRSPEFRPGSTTFAVDRNQAGRPSVRACVDGQIVDWSVRSAIAGKRPTIHTQLTLAMRRAVRSQVLAWKGRLAERRCSMCHELADCLEADHVVPFILLIRGFMDSRVDRPGELVQVAAGFAFRPEDMGWEAAWQKWHEEQV